MTGTTFGQRGKWDRRSSLEFGWQNVHFSFSSLLELPMELPVMEKGQMLFLLSWKMHSQHMEMEAGKLQVGFGGVPALASPAWCHQVPALLGASSPCHRNRPNCQENTDKLEHGRLEWRFPQLKNVKKKKKKPSKERSDSA